MDTLYVGGPCAAREVELTREDMAGLAEEHRLEDLGTVAAGREGSAVRLGALIDLARPSGDTRFVHVTSADGDFTANVALDEARRGGVVLYRLGEGELPRKFGGPFRLFFADGEDCSVNVKFLGRIELLAAEGAHTARCSDEG